MLFVRKVLTIRKRKAVVKTDSRSGNSYNIFCNIIRWE